ncbi:hypothetical protein AWB69_00011 [Caballeronia udeis]|uniref:Antitoxin SocA-like Panacea domain-containing protein n=1 Tax=Caballeronia udeis TaxID=1232866 RepID=A0A158EP71_9BURK|nr:Panacea domain-containing protein [Caballeronia udeis]SAL09273.1 hypothetical protein AWB69_00011 [Caballeronia udeis]
MFSHLFDERKALDAAMYLLVRNQGAMSAVKLNRLLYLAERESFKQHGEPLTGDQLLVLETSPVLYGTYQRLGGDVLGWENRINSLANREVEVRTPIFTESPEVYFDRSTRLSNADIEVLDFVWATFGKMTESALADHIHMKCPEWTDSNAMPSSVTHEKLFRALDFPDDVTAALLDRLEEIEAINANFPVASA